MASNQGYDADFREKFSLTIGWVIFLILLFLIVWLAAPVLFLIFGALLLAVFLRGVTRLVKQFTGLSDGLSLAIGSLLLISLVTGAVLLLSPHVNEQVTALSRQLPRSISSLRESFGDSPIISDIIDQIPPIGEIITGEIGLSRVTGWFSSTLGIVANLVLLIFVGLYLAANPESYRRGVVSLFPKRHRRRAAEIIDEVGSTLKWWLLGQFTSMTIVGVLTAVGLWLLGIPLALTLGLIAAILTFIPNFGPVASVVPAALIGLMQSPSMMLYVILLYVGVQMVESYLITPQIQKRTVTLPPALTIISQIMFGLLFGLPGLIFATPLTAVLLVVVKMAYIEDILGDSVSLPSDGH